MTYYASIANAHTGKWIGGFWCDAVSDEDVRQQIIASGISQCAEILILPGETAIDEKWFNRLLTQSEVVESSNDELIKLEVTDHD